MQRHEFVLTALAAGGEGAEFTPVQVQKLLFLVDTEAGKLFGGPHFDFKPYDYGPFDREVYQQLDTLAREGKAQVGKVGRYRSYALSEQGFIEATNLLNEIDYEHKKYLESIAQWVRALTFEQLVSAVYKRYPEMKVNSVFNG